MIVGGKEQPSEIQSTLFPGECQELLTSSGLNMAFQLSCLSDIRGSAKQTQSRDHMVDEACCASQPGALQVAAVPICRSFIQDTLPIVLFPRSNTPCPEEKQMDWKLKAEAQNGYCDKAHILVSSTSLVETTAVTIFSSRQAVCNARATCSDGHDAGTKRRFFQDMDPSSTALLSDGRTHEPRVQQKGSVMQLASHV